MTQQNSNLHFINLPAGSGKTTSIKEQIREWLKKEPNSNILVITYTNRAVMELKGKNFGTCVQIMTIHSFVAKQIEPFFSTKEIVSSYFKRFKENINSFLQNEDKKVRIKKFQEDNNLQDYPGIEDIERSTTKVEYGKCPISDYLHAKLGHDDLLTFYIYLVDNYPMFKYRFGKKYQLIIIDECQDTNPQILNCIASIAGKFSVECYAYGDLMQQIFNKDEDELRKALNRFISDRPETITNYRSASGIVDMLNKLYNNKSFIQEAYSDNNNKNNLLELYISNNQSETIKYIRNIAKENNEKSPISLVVFTKERFEHYGLSEIYSAYSVLNEYRYGSRFSVQDVLLPEHYDDTPDYILKFMFGIVRLKKAFKLDASTQFASIVKVMKKDFRNAYNSFFDREISVSMLSEKIAELYEITSFSEKNVAEILRWAGEKNLVDSKWAAKILEEDIYKTFSRKKGVMYVKNVKLEQFEKLYNFVEYPEEMCCSTQHGVKGEGHDSIIFEMEDSLKYNPFLPMYQCMKFLSSIDSFSLDYLLNKYNEIQKYWEEHTFNTMIEAMKCHADNSDLDLFYKSVLEEISQKRNYEKNTDEEIKNECCEYVIGLMTAFRIFYVGCSRAKKILRIVMSQEKLEKLDIKDSVKTKFIQLGFKVIQDE